MKTLVFKDKRSLGSHAAGMAAACIRAALEAKGSARIIVATGASQFDFLEALTRVEGIDWKKVTMFHLDEYVGMPEDHPASFRRYLKERLISKVGMGTYHLLSPETDPVAECRRAGKLIQEAPIDAAFIGIGENGHLAFNDPPADFETEEPYLVVTPDKRSRQQLFGEGWFEKIEDMPSQAVSMSIRQIMKSRTILCIVPEARKAEAVRATLREPISPMVPASVLRTHPDAVLFLDRDSSSLLSQSELA